jgi:hypothetical protein
MNILAYFSDNGVPATGLLIPTIKIREIPVGTLLVNGSSMTEIGDGFYSYDFTTYDSTKDYAIICDGTASLSDSDRYVYAGNENYIDDIENSNLSTQILGVSAQNLEISNTLTTIPTASSPTLDEIVDAIWDEPLSNHVISGTFGGDLATSDDVNASVTTIENSAISGTVIYGTTISGDYEDTITRDDTYFQIQEDVTNGITVEFTFNIPDENRPGAIKLFGRYIGLPATTHYIELWAYNYESASWENLQEIFLPGGNTSDTEYIKEYYEKHIDRDNNNEVKIRLIHNTTSYNATHQLYIDSLYASSIDIVTASDIADAVWDEPLDASTHNVPRSAGRRLRQVSAMAITDGVCQGNGNGLNQIVLNGDAWTTDGAYDPAMIAIVNGTGSGQCRNILQYDGATKTATVDRNWKIQPIAEDSEYIVYSDSGREHVNEGLARGAGSSTNTIILNALASPYDDAYNGQTIFIRSGKGEDQACKINDYDGTTKEVTITHDWWESVDDTSAYVILPTGIIGSTYIANSVWGASTSTHNNPNTFGNSVNNINTNTESISASIIQNQEYLKRIIGLVHENIFIDNPIYDGDGNLTSARLRIYSTPGDVGSNNNVIGEYQITSPGDGPGRFTNWKQVRTG